MKRASYVQNQGPEAHFPLHSYEDVGVDSPHVYTHAEVQGGSTQHDYEQVCRGCKVAR